MDVNLIGRTQGARGFAGAETANAADAALFQSLIAAALLRSGGAAGEGAEATLASLADNSEGAGSAMLMKLLMGGALAGIGFGPDAAATGEALLATVTGTDSEELIAASGRPGDAAISELIAAGEALLEALTAPLARISADSAGDASANSAAVETLIANAEAAKTPLNPGLADDLAALMTDAGREAPVFGADGTFTAPGISAEAAELARDWRAALPRVENPSRGVPSGEDPELAESARIAEGGVIGRDSDSRILANAFPSGEFAEAVAFSGGVSESARGAASAREGAPGESGASVNALGEAARDIAAQGTAAQDARQTAQTEAPPKATAPYAGIANEIFAALAGKKLPTTLSVRLEPAELGRVDLSLRLTAAGKLVIDVAAESAKTQALLAGQTDKLVQALGLQNVQVESLSLTDRAAFSAQQQVYAYADRSMAFFMDFAGNGGRDEAAGRDEAGKRREGGSVLTEAPEESATGTPAIHARRMDLTA